MDQVRVHWLWIPLLVVSLTGCPSAPPERLQAWVVPAPTAATATEPPLPSRFNLVSWNVHKQLGTPGWQQEFSDLQQQYSPHLMALQEVNVDPAQAPSMLPYHYAFGANLVQFDGHQSGVMSLAASPIQSTYLQLSAPTEPVTNTPKASLISEVTMADGQSLLMINIHGINFVTNSDYRRQLDTLEGAIDAHRGPVIFAGDFNTWSDGRKALLDALAQRQGLASVQFADSSGIKQFFGHELDHILYSCQLTPVADSADVLSQFTSSDHTPLYVQFDYQPSCG
ncbi:endonuclease/exonuclease/phosphatase family protein [Ferrimonas sp. SCSIO 43195]|uniref:endonuclease/exonuclease/phosphatase family protein n=1 Tax=Ferrimonas sp. SCSIO 43195 TaxID=2822844 RepID=UPI002075A4A3|nr:endonuclease/exonuclease/phosphatase family protein [Ferrimonas sp. SCSIO 43195]USD39356.1 endonuclease/exonuclease/phosphatase family protein [Ferrimonas sp. SCSIO 43195]